MILLTATAAIHTQDHYYWIIQLAAFSSPSTIMLLFVLWVTANRTVSLSLSSLSMSCSSHCHQEYFDVTTYSYY